MLGENTWAVILAIAIISFSVFLTISVKGCNDRLTRCYDAVKDPTAMAVICRS